jgi:hypothetical protein
LISYKIQGMDASVPSVLEEERHNRLVPENDDEPWRNVPYVNWNRDNSQVNLNANWRSNDNSNYSVPTLREYSLKRRSLL